MRVRVRIPTMEFHTFLDPNSYFPESSIAAGLVAGARRAAAGAQALGGWRGVDAGGAGAGPSSALSTLRYPFVWMKGVLNGYSSTRVSLWDSLMFGRLAMGFADVRAGTRVLMLVLVQPCPAAPLPT